MKRPPGLWLLLSAGVLWLTVQNVHAIKATSLIFGKTTTTTAAPINGTENKEEGASASHETTTEAVSNVTKPTLTGIPQIDYIWDPNLPRELNGYNLTEYPFYDRVPEDIDFKCDGLHDGFYASVPHKCQVYHHCLFGTRYDFLCANYTAFDQKTFICHFVSEVDCVNSKKFWHRNDALYKSASTTTVKPTFVYTPPANPHPVLQSSAPAAAAPESPAPAAPLPPPPPPRRPPGRRQRPLRRRRPQYDYYDYEDYDLPARDDYYEEPRATGNRRKRPRPRPRPVYDDEYEEYEEEVYERRRPARRPYRGYGDRRGSKRGNKNDRRNYDDLDDAYEDEPPRYNRRGEDKKSSGDNLEDEKRPSNKRPPHRADPDDIVDEEEPPRPRKPNRRPPPDLYDDEEKPQDRRRPQDDDRKPQDDVAIIKSPSRSSVYDRPRTPPKVRPPVPKSAQEKYAYKPVAAAETKPKEALEDEEYYDEYEEEPPPKKQPASSAASNRKTQTQEHKRTSFKASGSSRDERRDVSQESSRPRGYAGKRPQVDEEEEEEEEGEELERPNFRRPYKRPKYGPDREKRPSNRNSKKPITDDYYDEYEDEIKDIKSDNRNHKQMPIESSEEITTTTTTTTTTTASPPLRPDAIVRIVKRPFLPSRGGNPLAARGLQPVGSKAASASETQKPEVKEATTAHPLPKHVEEEVAEEEVAEEKTSELNAPTTPVVEPEKLDSHQKEKAAFRPSPVLHKVPIRPSYVEEAHDKTSYSIVKDKYLEEEPSTTPSRPPPQPRTTTQRPQKSTETNPLDINEDEYDVTLNEALNPTLPNLPVRAFPTGFSSDVQRPRFDTSAGLHQDSSDYSYQVKPPAQRFHAIPVFNSGGGAQYTNSDYNGQYSHFVPTFRRVTQAQTRGYFPSY